MEIAIPFVVSTKGYGLLWDNDGISRFGNPRPYRPVGEDLTVTSGGKAGWKADYYLGGTLAVSRQEATINYQFIRDQKTCDEAAKATHKAYTASGQHPHGVAPHQQKVGVKGQNNPANSVGHNFRPKHTRQIERKSA